MKREAAPTVTVALAGNPNVGKSTVFNNLTGMRQHTGNWAGKTVETAVGDCRYGDGHLRLVDLPGTYSLLSRSPEEEVARSFLCGDEADGVLVVCDATCPERNLNLVLQILEMTPRVAVCVNLMDEARRQRITVSTEELQRRLGIPVIGISARSRADTLRLKSFLMGWEQLEFHPTSVSYPREIEASIQAVADAVPSADPRHRWRILRLLQGISEENVSVELTTAVREERQRLSEQGYSEERLQDTVAETLIRQAQRITDAAVSRAAPPYCAAHRKADKLLTGKPWGYLAMMVLLLLTFYLTVRFSNYPSAWLSALFDQGQKWLTAWFTSINAPDWLHGCLVLGIYRTLGWVVSVMLPPMAIFFPLFTLLEDVGYLPRVAYNLDRPFCRCHACGKQALTLCMGFGCNAVGVMGCRIIDSKRERLLAILTNAFVPCNGKFPALISILTLFFVGNASGLWGEGLAALCLTLLILLCVGMTFLVTKLLSVTLLRGEPSAFTLELPPYRMPRIGRILLRSVTDRTLFVLGRAVSVAAPAGLVLWLMANVTVGDASLLSLSADFLDPFARLMGLDGVILMAFILGFPANETVIPIMLMAYLSKGTLVEADSLSAMGEIFLANGWTTATAFSVLLFFLFHWPCSTTLLTVKKETGSLRATLLAAALPTVTGMICCMLFTAVVNLFS